MRATLTGTVYFRLLSEILKETSEDIEEIEYLTDGSWRPIRDDKEWDWERERSNTPEYPVVDICKCQLNLLFSIRRWCEAPFCNRFFKRPFSLQAFLKQMVIRQPTAAPA